MSGKPKTVVNVFFLGGSKKPLNYLRKSASINAEILAIIDTEQTLKTKKCSYFLSCLEYFNNYKRVEKILKCTTICNLLKFSIVAVNADN